MTLLPRWHSSFQIASIDFRTPSGSFAVFCNNEDLSTALSWCNTMSLILTIFFLVFLTELVSWVGKSVLVEFVCRLFACLEVRPRIHSFAGLEPLLQIVHECSVCKAARAQSRAAHYEEGAYADQRSRSIRQVGQVETERRQGDRRA